jgi:hypothetical protein
MNDRFFGKHRVFDTPSFSPPFLEKNGTITPEEINWGWQTTFYYSRAGEVIFSEGSRTVSPEIQRQMPNIVRKPGLLTRARVLISKIYNLWEMDTK